MPADRQKQGRNAGARRSKKAANNRPAMVVGRTADGKFAKGFSGNPAGQPVVAAEVRELARMHGPAAIARLAALMYSKDLPTSIAACKALLDRGYGRPIQPIAGTAGGPLVNITMQGNAAITDAADAARIYQEICGNPAADISGLTFAAPEPPQLAHAAIPEPMSTTSDIESSNDEAAT